MVAEGLRLVEELLASGLPISELFVTEGFPVDEMLPAGTATLLPEGGEVIGVTGELMAAMADTVTPQGVLAVLPIPELPAAGGPRFVLIPDQVRDPGNLGTMLRTAWAAGVTQVLLPPGTVDPTNPKVVRAGMGAHFHLSIRTVGWDAIGSAVACDDVWLAEAGRGQAYHAVDWRGDVALIIGGEAAGAGGEARDAAACVQIPMRRGVESLNAAVAAGILLFEAARQRGEG